LATTSLEHWVALNLLPGLGPILQRRCLERCGDPGEIAYRVPSRFFHEIRGMRDGAPREIERARRNLPQRVDSEIRSARGLDLRLVPWDSGDYPAALAAISDPPLLLYMRGDLPPARVRIAVVGARRATHYGRRVAAGLGSALAARGVEVVSGGARGIDTCAHLGALDAPGRTVAVMGSGFFHLYPAENRDLYERIAASGCVLTEFPLDTPPLAENFPRRNRLISGLSAAVVVVEAAERSGTLSTAGHALEQGREVMAVPGPISSDLSVGCHRLIQQGAKLVHRTDDVLDELSPMYRQALIEPAPEAPGAGHDETALSADERAVLALLDDPEPVQLDVLCDLAPFGIARVQVALFGLEVRGSVEQLPGGYYLSRLKRRR
jgi:DNA processing protein